jgi:methylated-DNA-[protein]-cysteine S-methyltransferase
MTEDLWTTYESPLGPLTLIGAAAGLAALHFPGRSGPLDESRRDAGAFAEAVRQLDEYFAGERRSFELPLDLRGTTFQRRVWETLRGIPYGTTRTYTSLASAIGRADHVRAAAAAREMQRCQPGRCANQGQRAERTLIGCPEVLGH